MIRPPKSKTMTQKKAELICDALWEQLEFSFIPSELLDPRNTHQLKPYDRELYGILTDGVIILIELTEDAESCDEGKAESCEEGKNEHWIIECSQLSIPEAVAK